METFSDLIDYKLIAHMLQGLKPDPKISVTEWADTYRILSNLGAEPGQYKSSRTPFLRKIMDALSNLTPYQKIVFMKSAQVGGTEAGNNWVGCVASMTPGPMLMVMPTDDTVKRNSKIRIDPMIKATPILSEKIKASNIRDGGNTLYSKEFPGGFLQMTGANSPSGLRSMPIKYLFMDEVDAYPLDLDGEGSPVELADARTITFPGRKIFIVSTPTLEDTSVVAKEYADTDQQKYHVPCPHCSTMQPLEFEQLKWDKGTYERVYYQCAHCPGEIDEHYKTWMLEHGQWVADFPELSNDEVIGFYIHGLYSPPGWLTWTMVAKKIDKAEGNELRERNVANLIKGLPYKQKGEQPDWNMVYNKREQYPIGTPPKEVYFITCGVDVQADRVECEVVGWGKGIRSWSIEYIILPGDTAQVHVWNELAKIVNKKWYRADGVMLPMTLMCVDTGYNTSHVYKFCQRFDLSKVVPVKGDDNLNVPVAAPRSVNITQQGKKIGSVKIWRVGVSLLKSELYGYVRQNKNEDGSTQPGYCSFPEYAPEYFKGLCSEQLELREHKGKRKYEWVRKYRQNEPLDCRNYARAAASMKQIDRMRDEHYEQMIGEIDNYTDDTDDDNEQPDGTSIWKKRR